MCRFCGCNVIATHDVSRADAYLDVLEKEVALVAAKLPRREASQLHWGGGTPTFLDERQLARCHEIIARHFQFAPDVEKAIEIDPAITRKSQIEMLAGLGFNRISMGVQDFDAKVQEVVGRIQGEKETADLVAGARKAGFKGVNLDLIYGLPYQTPETWKRTLERIVAIHPDRHGGLRLRVRPLVEAAPAAPSRRRRCRRPSSASSCSSPRWRRSRAAATG